MLEFSPKLRQEPITLLKSIRKMERIAKEKGEAMVSHINYHQDALVNQVEFTESGYKLKDSNKMQYSFYHKIDGDFSSELIQTEDVEQEIKKSLVKTIKNRTSQIALKEKNESIPRIERVTEDLDGEVSNQTSKKASLLGKEELNNFGGRNTLEKMIYENVGIDLSAQPEDTKYTKNNFHIDSTGKFGKNEHTVQSDLINIQTGESERNAASNPEVSFGKNKKRINNNQKQESEVKEIDLNYDNNQNEIDASDELSPEIQDLISSVNKKKNLIDNNVYADYFVYDKGELMSSKEFINETSSGPREVNSSQNKIEDKEYNSDYAREYELYDGKLENIVNLDNYKKKRNSNQNEDENENEDLNVNENEDNVKNNYTLSQKEIDNIIEDKIQEVIDEEIKYQNSKKYIEQEKNHSENNNVFQPIINKKTISNPNHDENNNVFHIDNKDPEYPDQINDNNIENKNQSPNNNYQGKIFKKPKLKNN